MAADPDRHSGPHAGNPPARQAAGRHPWPADDRARLAARDGRRGRPGGRGNRQRGDRRGRAAGGRRGGDDAAPTMRRARTGFTRRFTQVDPDGEAEIIVNLQGDLPTLDPHLVTACLRRAARRRKGPDIATLAAEITDDRGADQPQRGQGGRHAAPATRTGCARSISRAPRRPMAMARSIITSASMPTAAAALERFVSLPPSPLEMREKLEQLRALEDGMRIDVAIVDTVPLGVDTPADLERAGAHSAQWWQTAVIHGGGRSLVPLSKPGSNAAPRDPRIPARQDHPNATDRLSMPSKSRASSAATQHSVERQRHCAGSIAYQGEPGANSHIACAEAFPASGAASPVRRSRMRWRR